MTWRTFLKDIPFATKEEPLKFPVFCRRPASFLAVELDALHSESAAALPLAGGQKDIARKAGVQNGVLGGVKPLKPD